MPAQQQTRSLVDIVVYLASLVSDPQVIAPRMDTVRVVTAELSPSGQLTQKQISALNDVKREIEKYLLTQDPVRVFTPESLEIQLENYISGGTGKRAMWQLLSVVMGAIIITALVAVLLYITGSGEQAQVVGTTFFAMLHVGSAYLFVSVLAAFTTKLRIAFRWICTGMVILGLSLVLQPVIEFVGLRGTTIGSFLAFIPPLVAAGITFVGATLYAKLSGLRSKASLAVLIGIVLFSLISIVLPHAPSRSPDILYALLISIQASTIVLSTGSAFLLYRTSRRMSELYSAPTRSLQFAVCFAATVSAYTYLFRIILGGLTPGLATWVMIGLVSLMGIAFLRSGYIFNKASRY